MLLSESMCNRFKFESRKTYVFSFFVFRLDSNVSSWVLNVVICSAGDTLRGGLGDLYKEERLYVCLCIFASIVIDSSTLSVNGDSLGRCL